MPNLLIFEGAELVGKSYLISQVYTYLEERNRTERNILDGCHWFNCDVGVFGTRYGRTCIEKYCEIAESMRDRNIIFEKFHITDAVYHAIYKNEKIDYTGVEERLLRRGARIIFCTVEPQEELFASRLSDRLRLYPHYAHIAQKPRDYIEQQRVYRDFINQTRLPMLTVNTTNIRDAAPTKEVLDWLQNS